MKRNLIIFCSLALLAILLAVPAGAAAQPQTTCFPQTGHCIGGRFAQYWQQNGGLAVFGYPLTDELSEQGRTVQYFERQRFELHTENAAPYDVLLGLLGEEVLQRQGIDWHTQPVAQGPAANCLWFPQTQHNLCDQAPGSGFRHYWTTHGLEFDSHPGTSYNESLALFGLPVTEPFQQKINGEAFQVQWFERARFEWHPSNPEPYKVLLGRLGAEVQPSSQPSVQSYANQDSPTDVLASFYNAINRQEYQRAYSYWESPPSPYDQFAQGYADTASVQLIVQPPTFIDAGAGNLHAAIPTVLVATRRDGSSQRFGGCYITHKVNIQPDVWHLSQAQIAPVEAGAAIPALLGQACASFGVPTPAQTSYADQNTPVDLLASFYNAINRQEYQRAYSYWQNPPSPYDQFAQGYADTASVQLIVQLPAFVGAATGNLYGHISTVLIATTRSGGQQAFAGCYTTHKANIQPDVWHLVQAQIAPAATDLNIPAALAQACPA